MTQNLLRGALFDLDGTLLDTYDLIRTSFHHTMVEVLGEDRSMDEFDATLGRPLAVQFSSYAADEEQLRALVERYRVYEHSIQNEHLAQFPGMREALAQIIADGWQVGVVTSKRNDTARSNLGAVGMEDLFGVYVGSDDVQCAKPDPEPVVKGARLLGLEPGQCFYVGDSPFDIQAGNAAGAVTVAVAWGQHPVSVLQAERPSFQCERPSQLPALLRYARMAQLAREL